VPDLLGVRVRRRWWPKTWSGSRRGLLEHRWAIPLRDAITRAGGFRLASEFISPLDLVALGLVEAEEAQALAAAERDAL
jgi:hypothetical protein